MKTSQDNHCNRENCISEKRKAHWQRYAWDDRESLLVSGYHHNWSNDNVIFFSSYPLQLRFTGFSPRFMAHHFPYPRKSELHLIKHPLSWRQKVEFNFGWQLMFIYAFLLSTSGKEGLSSCCWPITFCPLDLTTRINRTISILENLHAQCITHCYWVYEGRSVQAVVTCYKLELEAKGNHPDFFLFRKLYLF